MTVGNDDVMTVGPEFSTSNSFSSLQTDQSGMRA